jgi:hypothetical protein
LELLQKQSRKDKYMSGPLSQPVAQNYCNQSSVLTISTMEIGPRLLTETSTVTTVGFSVREVKVVEGKCQTGEWSRGWGRQKGGKSTNPSSLFVLSWQDPAEALLRVGHTPYRSIIYSTDLISQLQNLRVREGKRVTQGLWHSFDRRHFLPARSAAAVLATCAVPSAIPQAPSPLHAHSPPSLQEGKNFVLLLTTNARAQFVVIVTQDGVQDTRSCWQFATCASSPSGSAFSGSDSGSGSSGLCFFSEELPSNRLGLGLGLGLGAVDNIILSGGFLLQCSQRSSDPRICKQEMKLCPLLWKSPSWCLSGQKKTKTFAMQGLISDWLQQIVRHSQIILVNFF